VEPEEGDSIEIRANPNVFAQINDLPGVRVVMRPSYTDDPNVVLCSALATPAGEDAIRALGASITVLETSAARADRVARLFGDRPEPPEPPA
jgi:hypothetical protein